MTQANEPNDKDRRIDRQLRTIARRVNRLENTQVTWGELNVEFDRLYDEIDELKAELTLPALKRRGFLRTQSLSRP
jgi:hypothetical protein